MVDTRNAGNSRLLREDGTALNLADLLESIEADITSIESGITEISGRDVSGSSVLGTVTISSSSATELKVDASPLAGRHTLTVNNDSSFSIFFGFDNTVTASTGLFLPSGNILEINLDPSTVTNLFAISGVVDTDITVIEIK